MARKTRKNTPKKKNNITDAFRNVKETLDSLVFSVILAFLLLAFVVQSFFIPTGSMADSLRGAHFRLTCPACAYQFNYSYAVRDTNYQGGRISRQPVPLYRRSNSAGPGQPICPMCGTQINPDQKLPIAGGDRILAAKYIYHINPPKIWDVVIFKFPPRPDQNYIKRLIGLPGQTIELVDGDVYIDGQIQRKPLRVQNELWIPIYDSDYQIDPATPSRRRTAVWDQPWQHTNSPSLWTIDHANHQLRFAGGSELEWLQFKTKRLIETNQNFLAYNGALKGEGVASDLKLEFTLLNSPDNTPDNNTAHDLPLVSVRLAKYGRSYRADLHADGRRTIVRENPNQPDETLGQDHCPPLSPDQPRRIAFANLDHTLQLTVDHNTLTYTGPSDPADWGYDPSHKIPYPAVELAAAGQPCQLQHVRLYRDEHYANTPETTASRATQGHPYTLKQDEFFVLGDNTTQSSDSRYWRDPSLPSAGNTYPAGVVPRSFLLGRALLVYWPAGYRIHPRTPIAFIPNAAAMRFIH